MDENESLQSSDDVIKDRARRLVEYLVDLAKLRSPRVRSVDSYERVLWLNDIPHEFGCFTRAWHPVTEGQPDSWVEVRQKHEPILPQVPEHCEFWIDNDTLRITDAEPCLKQTIVVPLDASDAPSSLDEDSVAPKFETRELRDYPNVQEQWIRFVEAHWRPWAEAHMRWQRVQAVYSTLFEMHKINQRSGEEYELVVGLGLLDWETQASGGVYRHILTARCELQFEASRQTFRVIPHTTGVELSPELDMLDVSDQPDSAASDAQDELAAAPDDPWNQSVVEPVLRGLAASLDALAEYHSNDLVRVRRDGSKPMVNYAPALILRKRSARAILQVLAAMRSQIQAGKPLPRDFMYLCEIPSNVADSDADEEVHVEVGGEILFPLQTNEEQEKIVHRLRKGTGVLVQGPPGTGKSHTIANLLCHLLASGKRVLITAQTPRALQVLRNQLPPELLPLCVSLLGTGKDERTIMDQTVRGIVDRRAGWDPAQNDNEVASLEGQLRHLKEEKARMDGEIRSVRERETYHHTLADGIYCGTAGRIGSQLEAEAEEYAWLSDTAGVDAPVPLSTLDLQEFRDLILAFPAERRTELAKAIPSPTQLPTLDEFKSLVDRETILRSVLNANEDFNTSQPCRVLALADIQYVKSLEQSLDELINEVRSHANSAPKWAKRALLDVLIDNGEAWRQTAKESSALLDALDENARCADEVTLGGDDGKDRRLLATDAETLLGHLQRGGSSRRWLVRSRAVRKALRALEDVRVNGAKCRTFDVLQKLVNRLRTEHRIGTLYHLVGFGEPPPTGPLSVQVAGFSERAAKVTKILGVADLRTAVIESLRRIPGLPAPQWGDPKTYIPLLDACRTVSAQRELAEITGRIDQYIQHLRQLSPTGNSHPIVDTAISAIENRDTQLFADVIHKIGELADASTLLRRMSELQETISHALPRLARTIGDTADDQRWESRLLHFRQAWDWARTRAWLDQYNSADIDALMHESRGLEDRIRATVAQLASARAWKCCFVRMDDDHRMHLIAWQQAMNRYGRGTGRNAPRHLRDAQDHLNACKDAIPAWIMPLHRVFDTIRFDPRAFDVVIVDEASQCGPEAIPLLYVAKQLVVVGDDKQISPEAGFINADDVFSLQDQFLSDFRFKRSFGISTSLYDHAARLFGSPLPLRRHFRCMPEIIRFSNDHFYQANPLIPMRHYPPDRLEPLVWRHVRQGYREGQDANVTNPPEALAVVDAILNCCRDARYTRDGKKLTMGVITLQGSAQARLIERELLSRLDAQEIEERRIICGEPYSFQGDERAVIFLSLVAAPNARIGTLSGAPNERRFNVAASRARDQMWLFHTATLNDLSHLCMRHALLKHFEDPRATITKALGQDFSELQRQAATANRQIQSPPPPFDSWFEVDVALNIAVRGFRVVPQFPVAAKKIDLMIEGLQSKLAVECDGDYWHGADAYEKDLERQRELERAGLRFWRVRESAYRANRERALATLWSELEALGIVPVA